MHILHVVAGLAQSGGGLSELVPQFAREAAKQGHQVTLATVARQEAELSAATREAQAHGVRIVRFEPCWPHFLFFSCKMLLGLRRMVEEAHVVHVHSNWTFPVWWACHCARVSLTPFVMTPHGCLDGVRLRHSAWKKRLAGLIDAHYLKRAAVIHATSEAEAEGIKAYLGRSPAHPCVRANFEEGAVSGRKAEGGERSELRPEIVVLPNGIDIEAFEGVADRAGFDQRYPACKGTRVLLFMSRLHPLKGVDYLLEAWRRIAADYSEWSLVIAGPDENAYGEKLKRKAQAWGVEARLTFCGPVYGEEKVQAMKNAELFVLPTSSENFGIVVAEALACGVPVITTKGAPWQELLGRPASSLVGDDKELECSGLSNTRELTNSRTSEFARSGRAGWWIDIGVEPLIVALKEAMGLTDEARREMGKNGRRLVESRYRWEVVAERLAEVYEKCGKAKSRQ